MTDRDDLKYKIKCLRFQVPNTRRVRQRYSSLVGNAMSRMGKKAEWKKMFFQAKTDFQRICFLLQAINFSTEGFRHGLELLKQLVTTEEIEKISGKSDKMSELFRLFSDLFWKGGLISEALFASTRAVFFAASPEQRSLAFARRCNILYNLGLISEAIVDGERALKHPCSQKETVHIHVCMGECFKSLNKLGEARMHFERAISLCSDEVCSSELLLRAQKGLAHCEEESADATMIAYHSAWQSYRPKAPQLVTRQKEIEIGEGDFAEEKQEEITCQLISSPKGLLQLKDTGSLSGWTIKLREAVSTGKILMVEKPSATSLSSEKTGYCYFCSRRCHNLIPCKDCAHVGFCSSECADDAMNPDGQSQEGGKGMPHFFDCHGLLPFILMEKRSDRIHVAFKCIANTNPVNFLNYICSTGKYEGWRGHQAFLGDRVVRKIPPEVLDPSDYSSVAWMCACSRRHEKHLWGFTVIALYLTYCLHLAGYPMKWFDEVEENMDSFFSTPSPSNCPSRIPASWIAACMLFHIQATSINSFYFGELISRTQNSLFRSRKFFGCCLYPTISLINHSCNPTVGKILTDRGVAFLFARRPLSAGTEISLSYVPTYMNADVQKRRLLLGKRHSFKCKCRACKNNWKKPDLLKKPEKIRCTRCLITYQESDPDHGCEKCHSKESSQILHSIKYKWIPRLWRSLNEVTWEANDLRIAADQVERAHLILKHPSKTLCFVELIHETLMNLMHGNSTVEPWTFVGKKQSIS